MAMIAAAGKSRFFYFFFAVKRRPAVSPGQTMHGNRLSGRPLQSRVRAGFLLFFF
ncbi:hypothetical protein ABEU95_06525 [Heyndrickxia faecalis]|uniref:hypothetical protein n=1 Tax=Heyndrickxia TaxID=2837504 RepID=UPI0012D90203|nr:hypothetical protein [Heyndrickxia coagulans]